MPGSPDLASARQRGALRPVLAAGAVDAPAGRQSARAATSTPGTAIAAGTVSARAAGFAQNANRTASKLLAATTDAPVSRQAGACARTAT